MAPQVRQCWRLVPRLLAALTLALVTCGGARGEDPPPSTVDFDVRPGGQEHSFSRSLGECTCAFSYAAQGGTNEQWQMSVALSEGGGLFSCSIWRPQGVSYLYFMQFKVEVKGCTIEYAEAYSQAASSDHKDLPLKRDEYEVGQTTVTHKQGKFKSMLAKVVIVAKPPHHEL
ncbi:hypothetical protein NDU88_005417 [Pleurodeles waltl]|uniref:Myeloid-derived growth factor n=1 Tax=Pleurodeles waltl TaxID=8319 RepID=A0AAV7L307_PLEWA|nr:hypothetical protein NDU88_005417 [Pleurodeles waltl]